MYGQDTLYEIWRGACEIPHKMFHPCVEICVFHSDAKINKSSWIQEFPSVFETVPKDAS